jgi:hypothetical protein
MSPYRVSIREILANAEKYHQNYYLAATFSGPSLHFHHRALQTRQSPDFQAHLEYVYATLASWGMNRMGKGGSKMQRFEVFRQSMAPLQAKIRNAQQFDSQNLTQEQWAVLKEIFQGIKVMSSRTSLVGNSKVMHHMMPNVIPPIDREYTLRVLRGNTNIKNDVEAEWQTMKTLIEKFFIPVAADKEFSVQAAGWIARQEEYPWDTSILKLIDNLLIGSRK